MLGRNHTQIKCYNITYRLYWPPKHVVFFVIFLTKFHFRFEKNPRVRNTDFH